MKSGKECRVSGILNPGQILRRKPGDSCVIIGGRHTYGVGKDSNDLAQVNVKQGESIDAALRKFKKLTMESGILKEARAHEHYEKPSDKRRREAAARLRKIAKAKRQAEGREIR